MKAYLDNAASTQVHPEVLEEMLPFLSENFGNPSSLHAFGRKGKAAIENVRKNIASYLNCKSTEIYYCSSGTEANNMALKLAVSNLGVERIITSKIEHKCVLNTAEFLNESANISVDFVELEQLGRCKLDHLENLLKKSNKKTLVSLMHIQNELGTINPIQEIGMLCEQYDAYFHSDTVQSIGHYPIDLTHTKIDFLSASAHKFHGPLGAGFLYVRENIPLKTWLHGGGHERNLRSGTENVPGIVGMGKALSLANENMAKDESQITKLNNQLKTGLQSIHSSIKFNQHESFTSHRILSVSIPSGLLDDMFSFKLDLAGIAVSAGSACSSGSAKASPVIEYLNLHPNDTTIRFSFSIFTSTKDIEYVISFFKKNILKPN